MKPHVTNNTRSGNFEWMTPLYLIEAAVEVMGWIDLDPATSKQANETVKARKVYTIEDNGLTRPWHGRVWLNPPYTARIARAFAEKLVAELDNNRVMQAVVLVNNATETRWFQRLAAKCDGVCLLDKRVKFIGQDGKPANSPLQGQAVIYFGCYLERFERVFSKLGVVLGQV